MHFHFPQSQTRSIHLRFGMAVFLNAILAITQVMYAHQAHSVSLLSDAVHNLGDVLGLFIAWCAQILARISSFSPKYTYGYQKSTLLATLTNSLLLLSSVGIILYETFIKLSHGEPMDELPVIFIAMLGIVINGLTALLFVKDKENNLNVKAAFLHLVLDALTSVGVVISSLIVYYGGYQWIDSVTALLIAGIISVSGWRLLRRSLDLVLGAVPYPINLKEVLTYLNSLPQVAQVKNIHIWALSTENTALTAHLILSNHTDIIDYHSVNQYLKQRFNITEVTLQPIFIGKKLED